MSAFCFVGPIQVQEEDVNFRNHVAHEKYFSFFQKARIGYLAMLGCTEREIYGFGMIMADAQCSYKKELRSGDDILVYCRVSEIKPKAFIMEYQIIRNQEICATGTTTNLCFDYDHKEVVPLPDKFIAAIKTYEGLS